MFTAACAQSSGGLCKCLMRASVCVCVCVYIGILARVKLEGRDPCASVCGRNGTFLSLRLASFRQRGTAERGGSVRTLGLFCVSTQPVDCSSPTTRRSPTWPWAPLPRQRRRPRRPGAARDVATSPRASSRTRSGSARTRSSARNGAAQQAARQGPELWRRARRRHRS